MKRLITALFLLIPVIGFAQAENVSLTRNKKVMRVEMDLKIDKEMVRSSKTYVLRPVLVGAEDTLTLKPVGYYSRDKFYPLLNDAGISDGLTKTDLPAEVKYSDEVAYQKWMDGANVIVRHEFIGCCGDEGSFETDSLANYVNPEYVFVPQYIYVKMYGVAVKTREANVVTTLHFPVNSTKLNPNHLQNAFSLNKINSEIEDVLENEDYTLTKVYFFSSASPEGKYSHNEELAKGRVAAIGEYFQKKLKLDPSIVSTGYEAEDMDGFRDWVAESDLKDKDAILAILDGEGDPDAKEAKIRNKYGKSWNKIKKDCFPELRKTETLIEYSIRDFVTPEEILQMIKKHPEDVSLGEFHIAASSLDAGSKEAAAVYRAALKQYPDDEAANLNAANAAMVEGDWDEAARLLDKAGNSAEAAFARGMLLCNTGRFEEAIPDLQAAAAGGIAVAAEYVDHIEMM
ncbi:MAG: hypothetical protein IKS71_07100 [Bacteroidales bacterium]|nr:hypothetical protein [Bacteroidales bacterium]